MSLEKNVFASTSTETCKTKPSLWTPREQGNTTINRASTKNSFLTSVATVFAISGSSSNNVLGKFPSSCKRNFSKAPFLNNSAIRRVAKRVSAFTAFSIKDRLISLPKVYHHVRSVSDGQWLRWMLSYTVRTEAKRPWMTIALLFFNRTFAPGKSKCQRKLKSSKTARHTLSKQDRMSLLCDKTPTARTKTAVVSSRLAPACLF